MIQENWQVNYDTSNKFIRKKTELISEESPAISKQNNSHPQKITNILEPNHTHFLLCDNGTCWPTGVERELRKDIECWLSKRESSCVQVTGWLKI